MRKSFIHTLTELAEQDSRIVLLTGDLGFMVLEPFIEKFPNRFINAGAAEQNMVGMATGMAEAGFIPFVYSIVPFAVLRPYEFIRNGPILQQLPVRVVGVGGGMEYGINGPSHHAVEDIAVMRTQPGITVVAPADSSQVHAAVMQTAMLPGPVYYRLGKFEDKVVPGLDGRFELGKAEIIREGKDVLFVTLGSIATEVCAAADLLVESGIQATVLVVSSFSPSPIEEISEALKKFSIAITVEEHYLNGGVGSFVSEIAAESGTGCKVIRCGVKTSPNGLTGTHDYNLKMHGLDASSLVETAKKLVK